MNFQQIKHKIKNSNVVDKYIYTIIFIFILTYFLQSIQILQHNNNTNWLINYFGLFADLHTFALHFYSIVTYSFIHVRFIHLLFNLITLYYIGSIFTGFFTEKQFHIYFIFGAIFGGIFFLLATNFISLKQNDILIGASASISAILVGLATKAPNYEIHIRFIGYVKLWIIAIIWIAINFVSIPSTNFGGQIAHLGGAFFGFFYTLFLQKNIFKFTRNKSNLKAVYKKSDYGLSKHQKDRLHQQKIDYLLDKISKSGYNSLSKAEREFLARAGDD